MIAAGLKGIEKNYELSASNDLQTLPTNLNEAISAMEKSELVRETLGRARLRIRACATSVLSGRTIAAK